MPKRRKKNHRDVKPIFHIFCEGEKTEPNYLEGYLGEKFPLNQRMKVIRVEPTRKTTAKQLVDEAVAMKKDRSAYSRDEYWVVYDRESVAKYSDKLHGEAFNKARGNSVRVALSNTCFEVWILLHFSYSTAAYHCFDDLIQNSSLKSDLKTVGILKYEKCEPTLFQKISSFVEDARRRAEKMNKAIQKTSNVNALMPYNLNPYTNFHKLLDAIDAFAKTQNLQS